MGLAPVQAVGRHRSQIQTIDVRGVEETASQRWRIGEGRAHERRPDLVQQLIFGALHHRHERKHVFLLRGGRVRRVTMHDGWEEVVGAALLDHSGHVAIPRGDVLPSAALKGFC